MPHELHIRLRPTKFRDVFGQPDACKLLIEHLKAKTLPHTILFMGTAGTGKTTLARILKDKIGCVGKDFQEINAAEARGIDTIRDIASKTTLYPAFGKCRVWLIDEAQKLTSDGQSAMLKLLEDVPDLVYFFLCTTDPDKILQAIRTRCTPIKLKPLSPQDVQDLLVSIATKENITVSEEVVQKIVEVSGGSAREAVKLLNSVIALPVEEDRLKAIEDPVEKRQAFDLVKALVYAPPSWPNAAKLIQTLGIGKDNHESFRHFVLACANTELLKAGKSSERAWYVIEAFRRPFFEYPQAGVAHAVYEVLGRK